MYGGNGTIFLSMILLDFLTEMIEILDREIKEKLEMNEIGEEFKKIVQAYNLCLIIKSEILSQ